MSYNPNNPNGQATKANSSPVTLASDQNNALETGGNLASIVTNTTGIATAANQTSGNTSLTSIATNTGRLPAQGAAVTASSIPVNIASDQTVPTTVKDTSATISISANATSGGSVTGLNGASTFTIHLTGTFVATLQVQVTGDGSTWNNITGSNILVNAATGAYMASGNMTAVGIYQMDIAGFAGARVITTAYTSGTVTGATRASLGTGSVSIDGVPSIVLTTGAAIIGALTANQSVNAAQINGVTPLMGNGITGTGSPRVTLASDTTTNTNPLYVKEQAQTTGGATSFTLVSAATTNATSLKASAGTLYSLAVMNNGAALAYLKLYNKASAPTVGTDTPVMTLMLPIGGGVTVPIPSQGIAFGTGIAYAITALGTTADTTAVAATQVFVNGAYA